MHTHSRLEGLRIARVCDHRASLRCPEVYVCTYICMYVRTYKQPLLPVKFSQNLIRMVDMSGAEGSRACAGASNYATPTMFTCS